MKKDKRDKSNPVAKHARTYNKAKVFTDRKKRKKSGYTKHKGKVQFEDLRKWFGKGKEGDWIRVGTDGEIKGDCARGEGEGKPKCMPRSKAHSMSKKDRASSARRKRAADPVADRPGTGNKPVMVSTDKKKKVEEKNVPTNPKLWSKVKAQAKSKFDVYPSAYANGWAAKTYKQKGGGWKTVSEDMTTEGYGKGGRTEHSGAKKGKGAFYGRKKDAKQASNKLRRADGRKAVRAEEVEQVDELKKSTLQSYLKKSAERKRAPKPYRGSTGEYRAKDRLQGKMYTNRSPYNAVTGEVDPKKYKGESVEHLDESQKLADKRTELRKKMFGDANYLTPAQRKQLDAAAKAELKKEREAKKAAPKAKTTTKTAKGKTHTGSADPAERNLIMQLRKAQDVDGNMDIQVSPTGRTVRLPKKQIDALLNKHDNFAKPVDKRKFKIMLTKALRQKAK